MEWRKYYLDAMLVPLGFLLALAYHLWLWFNVRTNPLRTIIGRNSNARRFWLFSMLKSIDKNNMLVVQTLRNMIMGSTLMATTSIFLCAGLAAVVSSTYSVKKPLNDALYGADGEFMVSMKYVTVLTIFLFSFFCHTLSIAYLNQVSILIYTPQDPLCMLTSEYVCEILEKGSVLNTVGNRLFYTALPLLLWIFGPVLVFLCFVSMVLALYIHDFASIGSGGKAKVDGNAIWDFV